MTCELQYWDQVVFAPPRATAAVVGWETISVQRSLR